MKMILVITGMDFVGEMLRSELTQEGCAVFLTDTGGVLSKFRREAPNLILVDTVLDPKGQEDQKALKSFRNTERALQSSYGWFKRKTSSLTSGRSATFGDGGRGPQAPKFFQNKIKNERIAFS